FWPSFFVGFTPSRSASERISAGPSSVALTVVQDFLPESGRKCPVFAVLGPVAEKCPAQRLWALGRAERCAWLVPSAVDGFGVGGRLRGKLVGVGPKVLAHEPQRVRDEVRGIRATPKRRRSEKRRIRLDEDALERRDRERIAQPARVLERHGACE